MSDAVVKWPKDARWVVGGAPIIGHAEVDGKVVEVTAEMPNSRRGETLTYVLTARVFPGPPPEAASVNGGLGCDDPRGLSVLVGDA